jgi:copper chaperone CopZ
MFSRASICFVLLLAVKLTGCSNEGVNSIAQSPSRAEFNLSLAPTVEFNLPDMMCEEGCAATVNDILKRQPGVKEVRVDFAGKTATVAIDERSFDSQRVLAALIDKGFNNSKLAAKDGIEINDAEPKGPVAAQ